MQHLGYGSRLIQEAEMISKTELAVQKIAVTSAVGTRPFYRRLGYKQDGPYLSKVLT
jgi:elongator complex protein 3